MPTIGSMIVNTFLRPWQEWNTTLAGWDAEHSPVRQWVSGVAHIIYASNDLSTGSTGGGCAVAQLCPSVCDPRTAACQASLSFTISRSLLKCMSIKSVMPSSRVIPCRPLPRLPQSSPASGSFPLITGSSHQVATVLELQLQRRLLTIIAIFADNRGFVYLSLNFYQFLPQVSYCEIL